MGSNPERFRQRGLAAAEALAQAARSAAEAEARLDSRRTGRKEALEQGRDQAVSSLLRGAESGQGAGSLHLAKNSLNGGELSPDLAARYDQQRAAMGCRSLFNMVALPWGGVTKRPPLRYFAQSQGAGARLLPFVFSQDESRLLELYCPKGSQKTSLRVFAPDGRLLFEKAGFFPFGAGAAGNLSYCQSADVIFIAHPEINPGKIMRYADNDWRYAEISFTPSVKPPVFEDIRAAGVWPDGESKRVNNDYVATAVDAETGEESAASEVDGSYNTAPLSESWYNVIKIKPQAGVSEFRVYRKRAGVFGFIGRIDEPETDETGREVWRFEDHNIEPDTADTPPRPRNPFEGEDEKPALVFMHQQRLGYAASKKRPLTVWLSQTANFESMAAAVPPDDDDAIEATLAAAQANSIVWAESDRAGLLLGTQAGEWQLCPGEGNALTPSDLSFQPQSNYGAMANIAPLKAGGGAIFAQRGGRAVRDMGYSFQDDRYNAADLSILARHIFRGRSIRRWTWQQEPWSVIWIVLSDGTLAGLTYLREYEVMAWHRHATEGEILDITSLPEADGLNAVFLLVRRGKEYFIEKMDMSENPDASFEYLDGRDKIPFRASLSPCLPEIAAQDGTTFLMVKKINSIKALVRRSVPFKARVQSQGAKDSAAMDVPAGQSPAFAEEAVWACPLAAGFRENPSLELVFDGPGPATVQALLINFEVADMAGGQE